VIWRFANYSHDEIGVRWQGLQATHLEYCFLSIEDSHLDAVPSVLSFENPSELDYFTFPATSLVMTSSQRYKNGFHSLVWNWEPGDKMKIKLGRRLTGTQSGIKFWIYRNQSSDAKLRVCLLDSNSPRRKKVTLRFDFSLNFTGWRAAWVAIREGSIWKNAGYNEVKFKAPIERISSQSIFMDLLSFCPTVTYQTRDKIVPPIRGNIYSIKDTWQQTYRWSRVVPADVDGETPLSVMEKKQLRDLDLIEKRLINWFANERLGPLKYKGHVKERRELMIVRGFQRARDEVNKLNITVNQDGVITGSPLFVKRSSFGHSAESNGRNKNLQYVTRRILFH
jgi:hypothetical protein